MTRRRNLSRHSLLHARGWDFVALGMCLLVGAANPARAVQDANAARAAVLARAAHLRGEHQPAAAADALRVYLQNQPEDTEALLALGNALLDQGKQNEAEQAFAHALASAPNSPAANVAVGKLLLAQHHDPEAMDRFETALAASPADQDARKGEVAAATELALSARREGHPELALEALRHACSKLPDDPQLLLDLGIQAEELGALPEAEQSLHAALALDPKNPTILYALARVEPMSSTCLMRSGICAPISRRGLTMPRRISAWATLMRCSNARLRHAASSKPRSACSRGRPNRTMSLANWRFKRTRTRRPGRCSKKCWQATRITPARSPAWASWPCAPKHYATAEQFLARAEKADPNYMRPHYYRGLALARLGRKAEADEELRHSDGREHATMPELNMPSPTGNSTAEPASAATAAKPPEAH